MITLHVICELIALVVVVFQWRQIRRLTAKIRDHTCPPPITADDIWEVNRRQWERRGHRTFTLNVPEGSPRHAREDA